VENQYTAEGDEVPFMCSDTSQNGDLIDEGEGGKYGVDLNARLPHAALTEQDAAVLDRLQPNISGFVSISY
jgi:hypothetical protein